MARLVFAATFAASLITARALRISPSLVAWSPALPDGSHYPTVTPENVALAIAEPDPQVLPLSWEPRIFLIKNFLSEDECDHVMSIATPQLTRSTVVDGHGGGVVDPIRNSAGMFVRRRSDSIITRIENRLANISMLPVSHQEDMQVLRYEPGQHYLPHSGTFYNICFVIYCLSRTVARLPRRLLFDASREERSQRLAANRHHIDVPERIWS